MSTPEIGDDKRYRQIAKILHDVSKPMRVLAALNWPAELRTQFLASDGARLPEPKYKPIDPAPVLDGIQTVRRLLQSGIVDSWFEREADCIEATALMLSTLGTPAFYTHSQRLYGSPTRPLALDPATPLALAEKVHQSIAQLSAVRLIAPALRDQTAAQVASELEVEVQRHFGAAAPVVEVVDELSANALATSTRIKVRRDALFTRRDAAQLLHHEAYVHVLTALNGQAQPDLPNLAIGHPGTTRTQEGLAVFAEFVSGALELDRLRRLADRVVAIQMACDGANFIDVYRWFLEKSPSREQAYEAARRIFRGAPLTGGGPFTKDCGYLAGLLGVSVFVRAAFAADRADTLGLLFSGKLDLTAIPALGILRSRGLCRPGRFLPPWALDPGWVLSYLTLNTFMVSVNLSAVTDSVRDLLAHCPKIEVRSVEEVLAGQLSPA
jgi:uncharacterized protein (TIGR02421 family)